MRRKNAIPERILDTVREANAHGAHIPLPLWYAGVPGGFVELSPDATEIVMEARRKEGITEPPHVEIPPAALPDPYAEA